MTALPDDTAVPDDIPSSAAELKRTRRLATAVLLGMVVVFFGSYAIPAPSTLVLLIRSMAEAGMVGGLADWFAVSALFRHPLGIPIPHTALLPKNQDRAAVNVGRFFETHFLQPEQIRIRVRDLAPSRIISDWLSERDNTDMVARELVQLLAGFLQQGAPLRALARGRQWLRRQADHLGSDADIADVMVALIKSGLHGGVADQALKVVAESIDNNRQVAVQLVQENSRWWIASSVDRQVANLVVNAVLSLLSDLEQGDTPLRQDFDAAINGMVDRLHAQGALTKAVQDARRTLVTSGAFDDMLKAIVTDVQSKLSQQIADNPETLVTAISETLRDWVRHALSDPEAQARFDARLADLAGDVIGSARKGIAAYVTDVIANWEPQELNDRFEAEIGSDLQYIRINGAALGSLIGGVLFGFECLLG